MQETITSLCYVSKRNDKTVELCRIADFHDDRFEPYRYDSTVDFYGAERDLLYGSAVKLLDDVGSIGMYEWSPYQDENHQWRTKTQKSNIPWTEVILSRYSTPEEIVKVLKSGWKASTKDGKEHDLLICYTGKGTTKAVFCPRKSLKAAGDVITLEDDIIALDTGSIDVRATCAQCKCRYSPCDSRSYLVYPNAWRKTGSIAVKSLDEILDAVVVDHISRFEKDALSRKERQAVRNALHKLSSTSMEQSVSEKLNCSLEEARIYVTKYLKKRKNLLEDERIPALIEILIESDSHAVEELRARVERDWNTENGRMINEAQHNIDAAKGVLQEIQKDQKQAKQELDVLRQQKKEAEKQTEEIMILQAEVEEEIQKRLQEAGAERASSLVSDAFVCATIQKMMTNNALASSEQTTRQATGSSAYHIYFDRGISKIEDDIPVENFGVAVDSLEQYCLPAMGVSNLVEFLFGCFCLKQHMVFAGETADQLAAAYSAMITGLRCPVLEIVENSSAAQIVSDFLDMPHEIIAIRSMNRAGYDTIRQVIRSMPGTQFIMLLDHEESLAMEPASFFTTFFPVLTDLFCQSSAIAIQEGYSCAKALNDKRFTSLSGKEHVAIKAKYHKWFVHTSASPLLETRCTKLMATMGKLSSTLGRTPTDVEHTGILYLYIPLLKCLKEKPTIAERLNGANTIDKPTRDMLCYLLGIEDE